MLEVLAYRVRGLVWLVRQLAQLADRPVLEGVRALEARGRQGRIHRH
jgi:hypothetical protein